MIEFRDVTATYPDAPRPTIKNVRLRLDEGELCLVVGRTGTGKTTLLRLINGLFPHFTGGNLAGSVRVDGRDTSQFPPRELADLVGVVGQDPRAHFVTDTVEDELAYTMESLGLAPDVMRRRVEETLDLLGLVELRQRPLDTLSGGQRQRVAIGAALTAHPRILVLDEPTSALDPPAAEEVLAALQRLVHDLAITVVMSEHRLERVVHYADRMLYLPGDGTVRDGAPQDVLKDTPVAPPVVELGRIAGWDPLPLTVRDARRRATALRDALTAASHEQPAEAELGDVTVALRDVTVAYGNRPVLTGVDLSFHAGEITALMGRNGAGKTTLLRSLVGLHTPKVGVVNVQGHQPHTLSAHALLNLVGMVPQDAADLLYAPTIAHECAAADEDAQVPSGTCVNLLQEIAPELDLSQSPRDLSEGQRLSVVLAIVMTAAPCVLLLDEPTRGLDYRAKERLAAVLRRFALAGTTIILATHDVELTADLASRMIVLADGEIVVDGDTADVAVSSPAFAPQIAKVVAPLPWLTVGDVAESLGVLP